MDRAKTTGSEGRHLANRMLPGERPPRRVSGWVWLVGLAVVLVAIAGTLVATRSSGQYNGAGGSGGSAAGAACGGQHTSVVVLASPEQAGLLQQDAADYLQGNPKVNGSCVAVHVESMAPAAALDKLTTGWTDSSTGSRPAVWVPPSSLWGSLLGFKVQAAGTGS